MTLLTSGAIVLYESSRDAFAGGSEAVRDSYSTHTVRQGLSDSGRYEYGNAAKAVRELIQHEWPE